MASKRKYKIALVGTTFHTYAVMCYLELAAEAGLRAVADNLTRGSALNALEVARALLARRKAA